jgi:hypothetical protein
LDYGESCYDFELRPEAAHDWDSASKQCTDLSMHLVVAEDAEENDWINTYLQAV